MTSLIFNRTIAKYYTNISTSTCKKESFSEYYEEQIYRYHKVFYRLDGRCNSINQTLHFKKQKSKVHNWKERFDLHAIKT